MPKHKRSREQSSESKPPEATVDPQVALFAQRHQEGIARQKADQRAEAERRKRDEEHKALVAAKDEAVARVKELRRRDRVPAGAVAEADAAYNAAVASLIEFETGAPPSWAPTDES